MDTKQPTTNYNTYPHEKSDGYLDDKDLLAAPTNRTSFESAASSNPPPPYPDSLLLHVTCDNGWKYSRFSILDTMDDPVYNFHSSYNKFLKPTMSFTHASSQEEIASLTFPCWSRSIKVDYLGQEVVLKAKSWRKNIYTYSSPTRNGETMTWDPQSCWRGALCVVLSGEDGVPIGRFKGKHWGQKKGGEIELLGLASEPGRFRDEVVTTGMVVVQAILSSQLAGLSAGAASTSVVVTS